MKSMLVALIAVLAMSAIGLLECLLTSWGFQTIWRWFASTQYGIGPTMASWYGIAVVGRMIVVGSLHGVARSTDDEGKGLGQRVSAEIGRAIARCIAVLIALGAAFTTGYVLGWIP